MSVIDAMAEFEQLAYTRLLFVARELARFHIERGTATEEDWETFHICHQKLMRLQEQAIFEAAA